MRKLTSNERKLVLEYAKKLLEIKTSWNNRFENLGKILSFNYDNLLYFYSFSGELQYFLKTILVFFILSFLIKLNERYNFDISFIIEKCITWATIASCAIIFSGITKIGLSAYEGVGFGTTSFFIAINEKLRYYHRQSINVYRM